MFVASRIDGGITMQKLILKLALKVIKKYANKATLDELYLRSKIREEKRNEKIDDIVRGGRPV